MLLKLNPTIKVKTPNGNGYAFVVIDYPQNSYLHWVVFLEESGKIETYNSQELLVDTKSICDTWLYEDVINAVKNSQNNNGPYSCD